MKNVLLLGDSIRLSYQPLVKEKLKGKANVYGPEENGRWAGYTLNSLRFWLPMMPDPDIIHINNGLWDLGDDYGFGRNFSLPVEYESALERLVVVLERTGATVIFATTTPTKLGKDLSDIITFNDILKYVAARDGLEINDLFEVINADIDGNLGPDNLHLSPAGVEIAASKVAGVLGKYL
ncbi:MAG: SGNH/GDSL hydrolase family protein [Clostridiales bacterium]|jgi:lysophospholipase L1-like esterase|nr:SGNH/GDSL hydrolase family protein [Clostridiales bacterium]